MTVCLCSVTLGRVLNYRGVIVLTHTWSSHPVKAGDTPSHLPGVLLHTALITVGLRSLTACGARV